MIKSVNQPSSVLGAFSMGLNGTILFAVMPIALGLIAEKLSLSEASLGLLSSAYFGANMISALSSPLWIRKLDWRLVGFLSNMAIALGALSIPIFGTSEQLLFISFAIAGFGAGTSMSLSMGVTSDMSDPDRKYAMKLGLESLYGAIILFMFPVYVFSAYGFNGFWYALSVVIFLIGLMSVFLPVDNPDYRNARAASDTSGKHALPIIGLICLMLFFGSVVSVYVFFERIGQDMGISLEAISLILAFSAIMGVASPFIAALLGDRLGRVLPQFIGVSLILLCLALLSVGAGEVVYGLAVILTLGGWYFGLVYQNGIIASADLTGRYASLMAGAYAIGATFGPGIAGIIIENQGYNSLYTIVGTCAAIAVIGFAWIASRLPTDETISVDT